MKKFLVFIFVISLAFSENLNFYCGITMKNAIKEMADKFENENKGVKIRHLFGSSGVLLRKLKRTKKADLYMPGSPKFIKANAALFSEKAQIGYNKIAIFVKKGNPKRIHSLKDFLRKDIKIGLGSDNSSVGKNAKSVLIKYGGEKFYNAIREKAKIFYTSREIISALRSGEIDAALNWQAVSKWKDNSKYVDIVNIPEKYAPKKALVLAITSFSKKKELAKKFLDFAKSPEGEEIMKKWGFK
jgi:molybdate transport system substrate-binding protein